VSRLRPIALLSLVLLVGGCDAVVLDPSGDVAAQQRDILLLATFLMLLIVVPVMALTAWIAWAYRRSNKDAQYAPDWSHSTHLELAIWAAPLLIVICLGAVTWKTTHLLDPYRVLDRIAPGQVATKDVPPLRIDVVALDWKWLFIYPDLGIATVNEAAAPVERAITFKLTSSTVMNSFYVPALAGQVYAMPAMETELHAVVNRPGAFKGFSANYSGAGFSGMRFTFHGLSDADFDHWVEAVRAAPESLDKATYLELVQPSENNPVHHYGSIDDGLYDAILDRCVEPGSICRSTLAALDSGSATCTVAQRDTQASQ